MHVLLLDVLGTQAYIFSTNKLREAAGASQLVAEVTTRWLDRAIEQQADPTVTTTPIVAVSGRALYTVSAPDPAQEAEFCHALLRTVTTEALRPVEQVEEDTGACGLHVLGVWQPLPDGRSEVHVDDVHALERRLAQIRARGAPPQARLARLPVVAACATSDLPASRLLDDGAGDGAEALAATSIAKRAANWRGRGRIREELRHRLDPEGKLVDLKSGLVAAGELESVLAGDVAWLGVVHADGNGIGDMIRGLGAANASYQERFQAFSRALDECTLAALAGAVQQLRELRDETEPDWKGQALPMVPLIASGDDLTTLIDGRFALPFVAAYLRSFAEHSSTGVLAEEAARSGRGEHLTAAAGVALVKPHFPFSVAYRLCEQACDSAKSLSRAAGVSALDWHVHYDSVGRELREVRSTLQRDGDSYLRRPYAVLRGNETLPGPAHGRDWRELERLVLQR